MKFKKGEEGKRGRRERIDERNAASYLPFRLFPF
jgi:hypothetical protein